MAPLATEARHSAADLSPEAFHCFSVQTRSWTNKYQWFMLDNGTLSHLSSCRFPATTVNSRSWKNPLLQFAWKGFTIMTFHEYHKRPNCLPLMPPNPTNPLASLPEWTFSTKGILNVLENASRPTSPLSFVQFFND